MQHQISSTSLPYPLMSREERVTILNSIRGMWKDKKPDPIKALARMRKESDRKLPRISRRHP